MYDKRKSYYLMLDTEAANSLEDPMMYDIGGAICDRKGNVEETFSFVIWDVFCNDRELFNSAYYADKRPLYEKQIASGERKIASIYTTKKYIAELCKKYKVKAIIAHNARFDYRSTTRTMRYLSKSKTRYFLPYGIPLWDTLKMAQDTICKQKTYVNWCQAHGFMTSGNKPKATAEILYRYISGNVDFIEQHTGLEDMLIEKEIFARCMRQHKKMRRGAFEKAPAPARKSDRLKEW